VKPLPSPIPQNPTHNPLGRGRVLEIDKKYTKIWGKRGDKWRLNSPNTLVPNIFLKDVGIWGLAGIILTNPYQNSSIKQDLKVKQRIIHSLF
jgi:hypothetical protein